MEKIVYRARRIDNRKEFIEGYYLLNESINEPKIHYRTSIGTMGTGIIDANTLQISIDGSEWFNSLEDWHQELSEKEETQNNLYNDIGQGELNVQIRRY